MTHRTALAIRHVAFEDLGGLAAPLARTGYAVSYIEATDPGLAAVRPEEVDLLVTLGGPLAAYETDAYPLLAIELDLLNRRMAAGRPTLGICLGAQLMAAALGARVHPGHGREIGWGPATLTEAGRAGPLAELGDAAVVHWRADTFNIPEGCDLLASTGLYPHQAFARGPNLLGAAVPPRSDRKGTRGLAGGPCIGARDRKDRSEEAARGDGDACSVAGARRRTHVRTLDRGPDRMNGPHPAFTQDFSSISLMFINAPLR